MAIPANGYLGNPNRTTAEFQDGIDDLAEALNDPTTGLDAKATQTDVDGKVDKSGDTMTGNLVVESSASSSISSQATDPGGQPSIIVKDSLGVRRASLQFDDDTGRVRVRRYGSGGASETFITLEPDGNASVNGTLPTADSHLTRKDYVDDRVLNKNWVLKFSGLSSQVFNIWGSGEYRTEDQFGNIFYLYTDTTEVTTSSNTITSASGTTRYYVDHYNAGTPTFSGRKVSNSNPTAGNQITQLWKAE